MAEKRKAHEGRFAWLDGDLRMSQCLFCRHKDEDDMTCAAFPQGIPVEIQDNEFLHTEPYLDEGEVLFEPLAP